jgi:hypothetical protein
VVLVSPNADHVTTQVKEYIGDLTWPETQTGTLEVSEETLQRRTLVRVSFARVRTQYQDVYATTSYRSFVYFTLRQYVDARASYSSFVNLALR